MWCSKFYSKNKLLIPIFGKLNEYTGSSYSDSPDGTALARALLAQVIKILFIIL